MRGELSPPPRPGPPVRAPGRSAPLQRVFEPAAPQVAAFIERIRRSEKFGDDVVHVASMPARAPAYAGFARPLPGPLERALRDLGIERPYSHQAEAIDRIRSGEDVLTVTPTASGKSLVYLVPTFEAALERPGSRALYLFPYKALAQDQLQGILELSRSVARHGGLVPAASCRPPGREAGGRAGSPGRAQTDLPGASGRPVTAAIYDGDTPESLRRRIKAEPPDILITNPDMLHLGILAHHDDWRPFFESLDTVVVDELHVYRGIFGSHLHHVLRRLARIAGRRGSRPRFIASSATVANPGGLGEALTGRPFAVVNRSGAPQAEKHLVFLNPTSSPYTAATTLFAWALDEGFRAIAFTKARKITELLHSWLLQAAPRYRGLVSSYRSGYLPEERRAIEARLFEGKLQGVIATSALELGVDIGGLDVCLLVGYPGSMVSTWQRIGRVGREDRPALTILVAMPDALDQYFMAHPDEVLTRGFEEVVFDPSNRVIARAHLVCAGAEAPLEDPRDRQLYGEEIFRLVGDLAREGALSEDASGGRWYALRRRPQRDVSLRSAGATYAIVDEEANRVIGTIDNVRAFHETHTGAIYLHHGQQYLVRELSIEKRRVSVVPVDVDYYTEVRGEKETEILEVLEERGAGGARVSLGRLKVTEELTGYEKRRLFGRERLGLFDLSLPPLTFETVGLWITLPDALRDAVVAERMDFMGGIHAAEHAMISLFPLLAICDRGDIGGISYPLHPQIGRSAIFVYDGYPGGIGLAAKGFASLEDLLARTAGLLAACSCEGGCPSCIQSPKCGNGNNPLDKAAALLILEALIGRRRIPGVLDAATAEPAPAPVRVMGRGEEAEPLPSPRKRGSSEGTPGREQTLFFDLETQKSAEEVGGWQNVGAMKIALAVTYNDVTSQFKTYLEKDVDRLLLDLVMADRVVGYNVDRFDLGVLKAYTDWDLGRIRTFDMLADIYRKLGFRLKLTDLAVATLGVGKTADGLQSLRWWKEGKVDLIEQYCRRDVEVTRDLFLFGQRNGYVLYRDRDGRPVRLPVEWK
ncbi:MAG TPA: DEAD/DEAH box helicase [Candidatus Polarisedimenticolia bacterium]|nr:DEAD/DEAH box helicase [Candidatus Polarisedimenticolia bacterium]